MLRSDTGSFYLAQQKIDKLKVDFVKFNSAVAQNQRLLQGTINQGFSDILGAYTLPNYCITSCHYRNVDFPKSGLDVNAEVCEGLAFGGLPCWQRYTFGVG